MLTMEWGGKLTLVLCACSYFYIKPGVKRADGVLGVDYFHGEASLLEYVRNDSALREELGIDLGDIPTPTAPTRASKSSSALFFSSSHFSCSHRAIKNTERDRDRKRGVHGSCRQADQSR